MQELAALKAVVGQAKKHAESLQAQLDATNAEITRLNAVMLMFNLCMKEQKNAVEDINTLVTFMLRALFSEAFDFKVEQVLAQDGTLKGVRFVVYEEGVPSKLDANGGGVINCTSVGVRFVFTWLYPGMAPILFMDEPMVNMDTERWHALVEVLEELRRLGIEFQFIVITHSGVRFPKTFNVTRPACVSKVVSE